MSRSDCHAHQERCPHATRHRPNWDSRDVRTWHPSAVESELQHPAPSHCLVFRHQRRDSRSAALYGLQNTVQEEAETVTAGWHGFCDAVHRGVEPWSMTPHLAAEARFLTVSRWEGVKPSPSGETFRYTCFEGATISESRNSLRRARPRRWPNLRGTPPVLNSKALAFRRGWFTCPRSPFFTLPC